MEEKRSDVYLIAYEVTHITTRMTVPFFKEVLPPNNLVGKESREDWIIFLRTIIAPYLAKKYNLRKEDFKNIRFQIKNLNRLPEKKLVLFPLDNNGDFKRGYVKLYGGII